MQKLAYGIAFVGLSFSENGEKDLANKAHRFLQ